MLWYILCVQNKKAKTAMFMRRLLEAVKDIKQGLRRQAEALRAENQNQEKKGNIPPEIKAEIRFDRQTLEETKTEQNRTFQVQNSLRWATWLAFAAAAIYAGVATWQGNEMRKATVASSSAAETAKQALVRGQRPWVGPENEPNVALNRSNEGIQSVIVIPIRNYGLSPAFHISYYLEPLDIGNSLNDIQEASKRFCQIAEIGAITTDKVPGTSFGFYMLPNAVQRILDKRAWNAQKPFNAVVGCVAYVDQFHDTPIQSPIHHTSLCFRSFAPIAPGQPIPQLFGCSFAESMD